MQVVSPGSPFTTSLLGGGGEATVVKAESKVYATEFHRLYNEGMDVADSFTKKFPLITLISVVACAILGVLNVLSFNIFSGAILLGAAATLGKSVSQDTTAFLWNVWNSLLEAKDSLFSSDKGSSSSASSSDKRSKGHNSPSGGKSPFQTPKRQSSGSPRGAEAMMVEVPGSPSTAVFPE